jgi:hypothetical protein
MKLAPVGVFTTSSSYGNKSSATAESQVLVTCTLIYQLDPNVTCRHQLSTDLLKGIDKGKRAGVGVPQDSH